MEDMNKYDKFREMTREEVAQKLAAVDKEKLEVSLAPIRARIAREKREREVDQQRRIETHMRAQHNKARRELEREKARRRELWMLGGGDRISLRSSGRRCSLGSWSKSRRS